MPAAPLTRLRSAAKERNVGRSIEVALSTSMSVREDEEIERCSDGVEDQ